MFTSFSLRNSRKVSDDNNLEFQKLLDAYSQQKQGQWLSEIPYHRFTIKWCDEMTAERGIMGAFVPWMGKTIFLMPSGCPPIKGIPDPWPELIVSTLVHELRHAWQLKKYKLLYILCCLPILREYTIEKDAWKITKAAEKFFIKYNTDSAGARLEELRKSRRKNV